MEHGYKNEFKKIYYDSLFLSFLKNSLNICTHSHKNTWLLNAQFRMKTEFLHQNIPLIYRSDNLIKSYTLL